MSEVWVDRNSRSPSSTHPSIDPSIDLFIHPFVSRIDACGLLRGKETGAASMLYVYVPFCNAVNKKEGLQSMAAPPTEGLRSSTADIQKRKSSTSPAISEPLLLSSTFLSPLYRLLTL